jgi:hypothetical protein
MGEISWNYLRQVCARAPYLQADRCLPANAIDIADQPSRRKHKGVVFEITKPSTTDLVRMFHELQS